MAIPSHSQIHGARARHALAFASRARQAVRRISPANRRYRACKECLQSTHAAIVGVLEARGAIFGPDGSVKIVPPAERFIVPPGQNPSSKTRALALAIVNAARQRDGLAPLVDTEESQ
jgi:hypothetical protein